MDMEPFQTYTKDASGEILPAVYPFKKKNFPPPSNKEKYFQKKMLAAQQDARDSQHQRIEDFYRKLDVDKGESIAFFFFLFIVLSLDMPYFAT